MASSSRRDLSLWSGGKKKERCRLTKPKILVIDIETAPAIAYTWRLFDVTISLDQLIQPSRMLCFGAKWYGEREMQFYSEWEHGTEEMVRNAHRLISEADAVVTYNGDKFDLPKLMGEFVALRLAPPPPPTSIDVYKAVRKLGLQSNKLAFVGPFLKVGAKIKHAGFSLWSKTMDGDVPSRRKMQKYCEQDVRLLEHVYRTLRPYIRNHPHMGDVGAEACGSCGGHHVQHRGFRRTKAFKIQRLQCQTCGSWSDGKRTKV